MLLGVPTAPPLGVYTLYSQNTVGENGDFQAIANRKQYTTTITVNHEYTRGP